jgi:hypothetical protein
VADGLRAAQVLYFAAELENLRAFQVADRLIQLFQNGMLPLGGGRAGKRIQRYGSATVGRAVEAERRSLYGRVFGFPGGDPAQPSNREFGDLWLRFVSAVSRLGKRLRGEGVDGAHLDVSVEDVRKSGRDLAANLSLHGYGVAHYATVELGNQIHEVIELLSDEEIRRAYGARDMWQVIDQVAALELGGARRNDRYRTKAVAGSVIIGWLAMHATSLAGGSPPILVDIDRIRDGAPSTPGDEPTDHPTDRDLIEACEQWLAAGESP